MLEINKIYAGNNINLIKQLDDKVIDLTITSPPYDSLRVYNGFTWDFENLAKELYRVTKDGGVVVWVISDSTRENNESLNSLKQILFFQSLGFKIETMIYQKTPRVWNKSSLQYPNSFEYMFIAFKNRPKTFNPIIDKLNVSLGKSRKTSKRFKNGNLQKSKHHITTNPFSIRGNVWYYATGNIHSTKDKIAFKHPAIFPEQLAADHIISWSNPGDLILDPFMGSGTVAKMAKLNNRNYIGFEISQEYCDIAQERINSVVLS